MGNSRLKNVHDTLLRSAFCAIWVLGFFLGVFDLAQYLAAVPGDVDLQVFARTAAISFAVALVALFIHAHLVGETYEKSEEE